MGANIEADVVTPLHKSSTFHVIGAGRSGTSLLSALLNAHPSIEVGFEKHTQEMLVRQDPDETSDAAIGREKRYLQAARLDISRSAQSNLMWGNKITTEQLWNLWSNRLDQVRLQLLIENLFVQELDANPVVYVLRDGRSCVLSKMNRAGLTLEDSCARWQFSIRCLECLQRAQLPLCLVRFENLVRRPQETLSVLCEHLGVEYDVCMLEGTKSENLLPEYRQEGFDVTKSESVPFPCRGIEILAEDLGLCGY